MRPKRLAKDRMRQVNQSAQQPLSQHEQYVNVEEVVIAGVPNLSLTMYPFSIPTDEHVTLQHFNRISMYPFSILTDVHDYM